MNKKAQSDTFSTIKNAILVLIVLVVVISVFYILLKGPIEALKNTGDDVSGQGDDIVIRINNLLGGCDPDEDEPRCSFGKEVECDVDGKWIVVGDCKED